MTRQQIGVVFAAAALTAGIYFLPRVVLQQNNRKVDTTGVAQAAVPTASGAGTKSEGHTHDADLDSASKADVAQVHAQLAKASAKDKRTVLKARLAERFEKANRFDSAAHYRAQIADENPSLANMYRAGDAYFKAQGTSTSRQSANVYAERARHYYSAIFMKDPRQLKAKTQMGLTYVGSETPMKGIALLKEVIDADPSNEDALYHLGILSLQSNQYERAEFRMKTLLKTHPENTQARFYLGIALKGMNRTDEARKEFETVIASTTNAEVKAAAQDQLAELKK